jgi:hypothetical protein
MEQKTEGSWLTATKPDLASRLSKPVTEILTQVAAESRDQSQRVYTQAEMVRAIELARGAA